MNWLRAVAVKMLQVRIPNVLAFTTIGMGFGLILGMFFARKYPEPITPPAILGGLLRAALGVLTGKRSPFIAKKTRRRGCVSSEQGKDIGRSME